MGGVAVWKSIRIAKKIKGKLQNTNNYTHPVRLYKCRDTTSGPAEILRGYWISLGGGISRAAFFSFRCQGGG